MRFIRFNFDAVCIGKFHRIIYSSLAQVHRRPNGLRVVSGKVPPVTAAYVRVRYTADGWYPPTRGETYNNINRFRARIILYWCTKDF